jgi:phosphatidate phosphatase APP1
MTSWKKVLLSMVNNAESRMDELRYRMYYSLGGPGPIKIVTYRGYGTSERLFLRGRVLEDKNIPEAEENDRTWENLLSMYKRMASDEIPHARLMARFQDIEQEIIADEEGMFDVWIEPKQPLAEHRLWHQIELELLEPIPDEQRHYPVKATGEVLVPPPSARFVVVSDIDDTVLKSDATHLIKMAQHVFLGNAHTRLPFSGVAALYRALFAGKAGNEMNPLFYVSSSPWNLYDLLAQFFNLQDIPIGPVLFLRNWGINEEEILPIKHRAFKTRLIRQMLDFYPDLPFILLGDSGQEDPEIYAEIVHEYGDRVIAVYIRNVSRDVKRPEAVQALADEVIEAGSVLVMADDSVDIARHAVEEGLISADWLPHIREEKAKDEEPPTPLEKLLGEGEKVDGPTVKVEGRNKEETKEAVKRGAVEDAVKDAGDKKTQKPPTVIVDNKEEKERRAKKDK